MLEHVAGPDFSLLKRGSNNRRLDAVADQDVAVTCTDDDTAGFTVTESAGATVVAESAGTDTFDVVLIEGPNQAIEIEGGASTPPNCLSELGTKVLLIYQFETGLEASTISHSVQTLGSNLSAVVINGFPRHRQRTVCEGIVSDLNANAVPALGALPEDRTMLSVTVQQVAEHLGGRWLHPPTDPTVWIDRFLIGGNIMDSGPNYFGRYCHQAVITRAERPDIQMASLVSDTRCLVLTGGSEPTEYIQVEASKKDVPIILVEGDTLSTLDSLINETRLSPQQNPHLQRLHHNATDPPHL